jgi:hypothetical protein
MREEAAWVAIEPRPSAGCRLRPKRRTKARALRTQIVQFDRDAMARWYANQHIKTDPGVREIYYLSKGAPDREIRLVEVNDLIPEIDEDPLEPVDFGVDTGSETEHKLFVLDVTPGQWEAVREKDLKLPEGWTLEEATVFENKSR